MNYVFGYGTGRCGTKSLAHLLGIQPGVTSYHESMPLHWLPLPGYDAAIQWLKSIRNDVVTATGYYWLKHIPQLLVDFQAPRFIHIWREKEEVVESFWEKKQKTLQSKIPDEEWFGIYPFLDYPPTKDTVAKTWERYHYIAKKMRMLNPHTTYTLHMNDLNNMDKVSELLDFVGVPEERQVLEVVHLHKGTKYAT
jgi:hypothetical protein